MARRWGEPGPCRPRITARGAALARLARGDSRDGRLHRAASVWLIGQQTGARPASGPDPWRCTRLLARWAPKRCWRTPEPNLFLQGAGWLVVNAREAR